MRTVLLTKQTIIDTIDALQSYLDTNSDEGVLTEKQKIGLQNLIDTYNLMIQE